MFAVGSRENEVILGDHPLDHCHGGVALASHQAGFWVK